MWSCEPEPPARRACGRGDGPVVKPSLERVQETLAALGGGHRVVDLDATARTAADAAKALGCRVDQIVKSLVFRGRRTDRAVLVTASGANRVDEARVAA